MVSIKEDLRFKAKDLGADLVGFLNLKDYNSPRSPDPRFYLPTAKSIIVLGFRQVSGAFDNETWARMPSYLYFPETVSHTCGYLLSKHMEDNYQGRVFLIPIHR
jgi:hypothetical protein